MELKSLVLSERGDADDVEDFAKQYSFVADAKAFRLSRTAKNQKYFKIQAMDNWKKGNHMQWLFAQFTNYQIAQVRYITNPLAETFVSLLTRICLYL